MVVSSVQRLCKHLISSAIQRCRMSDDLCRLSVIIRPSPPSDPPVVRISVADTGVGSSLQEFQCLKYTINPASDEKWDGLLSLTTTGIGDNEIFYYHLNLKEIVSERRVKKLPPVSKNGTKFSGTEVSLSVSGKVDGLIALLTDFVGKMLILKMPNVAIDLVIECGDVAGSQCGNLVPANECIALTTTSSSIEHLKSGFENYVFKHGNSLNDICHSCFSSGHLKVGSGVIERHSSTGQVMEAVVIISELPKPIDPSCFRACGLKTEVLYFKDYSPCSISQSSLNALTSIDWKSYGLILRSITDQDGHAFLEWENLPADAHVDLVLHSYHTQVMMPFAMQKTHHDGTLTKKAVKLALDDLKEKNTGALLSAHALKICSYAPDLARTIAGLILSSNDLEFRGECFLLLGLQPQDIEKKIVEDNIERKIILAIEMNDRKPKKRRHAFSSLFEDDYFQEPQVMDEEYEGDEEAFSSL